MPETMIIARTADLHAGSHGKPELGWVEVKDDRGVKIVLTRAVLAELWEASEASYDQDYDNEVRGLFRA